MATFDVELLASSAPEPLGWPKRPWLSIWIRPGATIRAIIRSDPDRHVILLAVLAGLGRGYDFFGSAAWTLGWIIVAGLVGVILLYVYGAFFSWLGGLFGGQAAGWEVRAALAWSIVPYISAIAFQYLVVACYWAASHGVEMFTDVTPQMDFQPWEMIFLMVEVIAGIWGCVIFLKCLVEVHGFISWKAVAVSFLPGLVLYVATLLLVALRNVW